MADAKKVSPKPVKFVFDTHHHGDHTYGNAVWTGMGATTIANQGVAEETKRYEPARWRTSMKERKDVADMYRDAPEPPQQTFTDSPHVMTDGTRRVEVDHALPDHGGAGGKEIPEGQRAFMIELRKAVQAAVAGGKKLDDLVKTANGKLMATLRLPDSVKNWVSAGSLPDQMKDAYNEVTSGKPAGDLPH